MKAPEQRIADAFVSLAGARPPETAEGAGVLGLLARHSAELLDGCTAAAVRARAPDGVEAAGSEPAVCRLELAAASWQEGPGHDCQTTDSPVRPTDLTVPAVRARWPRYAAGAAALGHRWATALPLRTEPEPSAGALTLLGPARPGPGALALGQSLADAAALSLEHGRTLRANSVLVGQLEQALNSRVFIEQAKGALSVRLALPPDRAFTLLRDHARATRRRLKDVAQDVVSGRLALGEEKPAGRRRPS
ncbi:ANTAR domain-containing protein [Streptomyces arenae]|nr:ANTAR domain-containing protein [Streptomyces arenae]